tara:strand:+ start:2131 stop:3171 length:1041 start_codon:yes stop_codon:yes gene_type:complete
MFFLKIILNLLSLIISVVIKIRNLFFDYRLIKIQKSKIPVISVGNLNIGGTGKTPHVIFLIKLFVDEKNISVISRGYGRIGNKTKKVILKKFNHIEVGDEPLEIKSNFINSKLEVYVSNFRYEGVKLIENEKKFDLIILDDGFQHRYLHRDINILLTLYDKPFYDDRLFPVGKLRENRSYVKRSDIVIVTNCPNNLEKRKRKIIKSNILKYSTSPIFFTSVKYLGFFDKKNKKINNINREKKYLIITGIANPNYIYEYLKKIGLNFEKINYKDHYNFKISDIKEILSLSKKFDYIITSEKDWFRLKHFNKFFNNFDKFLRLKIEIKFTDENQKIYFHSIISKLLSK